jgi:hypothetical protein
MAETLDPLTTVEYDRVAGGHGVPFEGAHYEATHERTTEFLGGHLATESPSDGPPTTGVDVPANQRDLPTDDGLGLGDPPGR